MNRGPLLERVDMRGPVARLRTPRVEDAECAYTMLAGRREILDWIEWAGPRDVEEMRQRARHWRVESDVGANYQLAILDAASAAVVGALSLRFVDHPGVGDLGYWIGAEHQRRGLATDAIGLAVWLAFDALEAEAVTACVFLDNFASRRALEKHGFELQSATSEQQACDARPRWNFRLTRAAWEKRADAQRPLGFELAFVDDLP